MAQEIKIQTNSEEKEKAKNKCCIQLLKHYINARDGKSS